MQNNPYIGKLYIAWVVEDHLSQGDLDLELVLDPVRGQKDIGERSIHFEGKMSNFMEVFHPSPTYLFSFKL